MRINAHESAEKMCEAHLDTSLLKLCLDGDLGRNLSFSCTKNYNCS
jgi:hypothetical protein